METTILVRAGACLHICTKLFYISYLFRSGKIGPKQFCLTGTRCSSSRSTDTIQSGWGSIGIMENKMETTLVY